MASRHAAFLGRWSISDLRREAVARGLVPTIGGATLWHWLSADAILPWPSYGD